MEVCEASGRPPSSYCFIKHGGKTRVEVTVGDEGPVEAGPYEHSWRSKGEAIDEISPQLVRTRKYGKPVITSHRPQLCTLNVEVVNWTK